MQLSGMAVTVSSSISIPSTTMACSSGIRYLGFGNARNSPNHIDPNQLCPTPQGNRVNASCGDEACEEVVVPCGDFAPQADGVFAGSFSDQVEGHVLQSGEVGGSMIGTDAAFIIAENHV